MHNRTTSEHQEFVLPARATAARIHATRLIATLLVLAGTSQTIVAQPADAPVPWNDPVFRVSKLMSHLRIVEKFARTIELPTPIRYVDGFDPEVVSVETIEDSSYRIRVRSLQTGVTTMILTDSNNQTYEIEILVVGDTRHLQAIINKLYPNSAIEAVYVKGSVVLRGWVTQPEHINEIVEVADQFYPNVLNQMRVGGVQQVLLKCKVLEVQRSKVQKLGINFGLLRPDSYAFSTPGSLTPLTSLNVTNAGPTAQLSGFGESTLSFGFIRQQSIFQGFVQALRDEGLLKIRAEPTLVTTNGHPASLLNGGEFPIVVPAGLGTVGIEWREFGVRMQVVPIILGGGLLRLQLEPEVSERDFANQVSINGVTVPALTVRRATTQVEMHFGETLAIAGLISNRNTASATKVPFFGELPVIGAAFSRKSFEESETELVILVTPEYVAPMKDSQVLPGGPGMFTDVPTTRELFLHNMLEVPKYGESCYECEAMQSPMMIPGYDGTDGFPIGTTPPSGHDPGFSPQPVGPAENMQPIERFVPPVPDVIDAPPALDSTAAPNSGPPDSPFSGISTESGRRNAKYISLFGNRRKAADVIRPISAERETNSAQTGSSTRPVRSNSTPGLIAPGSK